MIAFLLLLGSCRVTSRSVVVFFWWFLFFPTQIRRFIRKHSVLLEALKCGLQETSLAFRHVTGGII